MRKSVVYAELFVPLTPVFCGRKDRTTMYMYDKWQKKINITEIAAWKPSPFSKNDARPLVFFREKRIIWAAVGRTAAIFLADIDLFFGRTTSFVFVGSRYNIFCVGGRESLNNPSNVPQSSSVFRQTVCWSTFKKIPNSYYMSTDHRQT